MARRPVPANLPFSASHGEKVVGDRMRCFPRPGEGTHQVAMSELGLHQSLQPALPPIARARTL